MNKKIFLIIFIIFSKTTKMNFEKYTDKVKSVIQGAQALAITNENQFIK